MSEFSEDVEAAGLLGTLGGLVYKVDGVLDVRPIISEHGHQMCALRVTTDKAVLRVEVKPDDGSPC